MYALSRIVKSYESYTEHWSHDGSLTVSYENTAEHTMLFDGVWYSPDVCGEMKLCYLRSAAVIAQAAEDCKSCGYPPQKVYEFLPDDRASLIPAELLRALMVENGLGIFDAVGIDVRVFGRTLSCPPDWDRSMQPRTARLERILDEHLEYFGFAVHNAYDEAYRFPYGALREGEAVTLSLYSFGGVSHAEAVISGDNTQAVIPMTEKDGVFSCVFAHDEPAALNYRFRLVTKSGGKWLLPDESGAFSHLSDADGEGFRLTVFRKDFVTPDWFHGAVMYQVFPDRFGFSDDGTAERGIEYHRSLGQTPELHKSLSEPPRFTPRDFEKDYYPDDFYRGTLRGIAKKLPYLKTLGVSVIYLNPIVEARSNHRYDTSDYSRVDPILGTNEDYSYLCAEAVKLGIRIVNDGVFSHTGADSIYFNRSGCYGDGGAYQSTGSEFYPWFDFRSWPDDYRCWWDFEALPEVDELNAAWQDYVISGGDSVVKRWLRLGASGWRLDVADELPDGVLSLIRKAAKEEKPDCVIIGEVWEDAVTKISYGARRDYALGNSLDSVMNYPFRSAVTDFALGKISAFALRDFLLSQQANYPKPMYLSLMNLLGSHDVERLHTLLALGDGVKTLDREAQSQIAISDEASKRADALQILCAAVQYFVPGVPCLYYGDEECLDGARDPFNRAPFEPTRGKLHDVYARLAQIRTECLASCDAPLAAEAPAPDVLILTRSGKASALSCVINRSEHEFFFLPRAEALLNSSVGGVVPPMSAEIFKL